jgi:AAA family ATP:ADP antiporter
MNPAGVLVGLRITFGRLVDVRSGEWRAAISAFATLAFISAAHAGLETARDALLVTRLTQREFALVYIAMAACAIPVTALITRLQVRAGPRAMLLGLLLFAACSALFFAAIPARRGSVVALFVTVGLLASCVFPQFWLLMGSGLTLAQSRRLVGPIASASVLGAVSGAAIAASVVSTWPIRVLLAICAVLFGLGSVCLVWIPKTEAQTASPIEERKPEALVSQIGAFVEEPFLLRIAAVVCLTTATALVIDYFFKSTVARSMPAMERGRFIARFYLGMNAGSLVLQMLLGAPIIRKLGVTAALAITPLLSLLGGTVALLTSGGSALPILLLKGADGTVRSSVNRLTTELVYMPVSRSGRQRAKGFIDGALMRIAQAVTAAGILAAGATVSPRVFSAVVVGLSAAWLIATMAMRQPYLGQLRRSLAPLFQAEWTVAGPIDVASAEFLVENLGHDDPQVVQAAMATLARRGRQRLIPALVLLHSDERVLKYALSVFATAERADWHTLAGRLLGHPSESVRLAAAHALASHGQLDTARLAADSAPSVHGYAAVFAALTPGGTTATAGDILDDARIAQLLKRSDSTRLGMLAAVADAAPSSGAASLLMVLAAGPPAASRLTWTELLAQASARQAEMRMIPYLVALLDRREGREAVQKALVALGEPALEALGAALVDPTTERPNRVHLPAALAAFGSEAAADRLLACIEHDSQGRVRYKAIRALEMLSTNLNVRVDRTRVERCAQANLITYFQLLALRVGLGQTPVSTGTSEYRLLVGLLDDKLRQSLERAFRLLRIAYPRTHIRSVYVAVSSKDKRSRANAAEYLDALLRGREEQTLRELTRLTADDLGPAEQVARARFVLRSAPPRTREEAVRAAMADTDVMLATLASLYAVASGDPSLIDSARGEQLRRPVLGATAASVFQEPLRFPQVSHA